MNFCFIFSTQKIKAIYLTFSICKRAILNLQQIVFANYYIFSKSQTKKKILQFYSLIGLMKYEAFDILYKYTFLRKRYLNWKKSLSSSVALIYFDTFQGETWKTKDKLILFFFWSEDTIRYLFFALQVFLNHRKIEVIIHISQGGRGSWLGGGSLFGTGSHQMPSLIRLSSRRENFRLVVRNDSLYCTLLVVEVYIASPPEREMCYLKIWHLKMMNEYDDS